MSRATELLEQATPLPWQLVSNVPWPNEPASDDNLHIDDIVSGADHLLCFGHDYDEYGHIGAPDARLIVYAVNRLPVYEAAVEALEDLADIADEYGYPKPAYDAARAALSRLREPVPA